MLEVRATTRFKKEVKKAARQQKEMRKLSEVIDLLQAGDPLPQHNLDHALTGNTENSEIIIDGSHVADWINLLFVPTA